MATNTSCSVFVSNNTVAANDEIFHLLIDAGGVSNSLEVMDIHYPKIDSIVSKFTKTPTVNTPDVVLIIQFRLPGYL
jgi:hypothetical protein